MKKCKLWRMGLMMAFTAGALLSGCGAASAKGTAEMAVEEAPAEESAYDTEGSYDTSGAPEGIVVSESVSPSEAMKEEAGEAKEAAAAETDRKLIRNVNVDAETEEFDELLPMVEERVKGFGGYVEESYVWQGSKQHKQLRNANYTLRIPAERLDDFLNQVAEISNVTRKSESITDVTLQYVDLKSHKEALLIEQERLLALLEKAETVEDIITIETRLSEVRYQIESMESQLRTMDNQVSYSTVWLAITEVGVLSPGAEQTIWERMGTGFMNSLYHVGEGIQSFFIGLIVGLPYILTAAVIAALLFFILRFFFRRGKRAEGAEKKKGEGAKESGIEQEHTEKKQ